MRCLFRQFAEQGDVLERLFLDQGVDGKTGMNDDVVSNFRPVVDNIEANLAADAVGIDGGDLIAGEIVGITLYVGNPHGNGETHVEGLQ